MPAHIETRYKTSHTIVIDLGFGPDGKRKRITRSVKGTKPQAEREMARMLLELEEGTYTKPSKMTFGEYLRQWWENYCVPSIGQGTAENYKTVLEAHIIPALGKILLKDLKPLHIQQYLAKALKSGRKDGDGGLSNRSVQYHHSIIRKALAQAVEWEIIARNPASSVRAPRPKKREPVRLGARAAKKLLAAITGHPLYLLVCMAVYTGLRRSELLGLKWQDVQIWEDEEGKLRGKVYVRQTLQRTAGNGYFFGEPKSAASRRAVPMAEVLCRLLQKDQPPADLADSLVFQRKNGRPLDPSTVTHDVSELAATAGFPGLRLHDLRHAFASILLEAGIHPKVVQELLGHASIGVTMDIYSHLMPTMAADAVDRLQGAIEGAPEGPEDILH